MNGKQVLVKIGKRIQLLRKEHKLSQETLAELTELHPTHISKMERGVVNASIVNLYRISKALEMTLSELFSMPSRKRNEKEIIIQKLVMLLRKQKVTALKYIEKTIVDFTNFMEKK